MRARLVALGSVVAVGAALVVAAPPTSAAPAACTPFGTTPEFSGNVPSPTDVLGFELGSQETSPRQIQSFVTSVDEASDRVTSGVAATSVAGRPLPYAVVGSPGQRHPGGAADRSASNADRLRDPDALR